MENRVLGGHIISFSAQNTPFSRKRPRPDLSGEALRRTVSGRRPLRRPSRRPVRLPHRPARLLRRPAWLLRRPAWLPHDPAPSSRRHDCHSSIPVPASSHSCSRVAPATTPFVRQSHQGDWNKKIGFFFGVFVKFLLLLQHIAVTTLYPRRNGLHAASASLLTREFR